MSTNSKVQIIGVMMATGFCCLMPVVIYIGDIYCRVNHIAPPDADSLTRCCIAGVAAVMAWGYPGVKEVLLKIFAKHDQPKPNQSSD